MASSIVVTRPQSSISGVSGASIQDISISPGATISVDSTPLTSAKWIYVLIDETNARVLSAEVLGMNRLGANPTHSTYSVIGDRIMHGVSVVMSGANMSLEITNNTVTTLKAHVTRINITSV